LGSDSNFGIANFGIEIQPRLGRRNWSLTPIFSLTALPVWLLPLFSPLARLASRVYYRVTFSGPPVPRSGPVLLVANHPNSLLDPTLVVAAAERPVRFLAKSTLFSDRRIGWLIRAAGAIPVYRRADDPARMSRNEDAFRAVHGALAAGAAVGIFPEGTSHSEPSMVPLRTGAARIALGAALEAGRGFPIVPVGLVFRQKDTFRSDALALRGPPVPWQDLAGCDVGDAATVRELTARIDAALRGITLNLAFWEDLPVVECAVRIWEAERNEPSRAAERVGRVDLTTRVLASVREHDDREGLALAQDVAKHARRLALLRLRPSDLPADVRMGRGVRWAARRLHLLMPLGVILASIGAALFWVPYQLTGAIVRRLRLEEDVRSTWKLLVGAVLYAAWLVLLVAIAGATFGLSGALLCMALVPAVAMAGLVVRERWRTAWDDARRFFLIRSRRDMIQRLQERQHHLAHRIHQLLERYTTG
jgi:1-acyl-sn-glycerol-3-phosphate acyltransferase